ncbi:hypothetical protein [Halorhodospira halophila]|nr:hypothetical protein [Halorhodospira halophila]MBK1727861.1 hypothetical protein [Halorhodospira halophila]
MPLPSTATIGVAVAGRAVHVCLRRRSRYAYTAETIHAPGANGRRDALRAACRRLGVGRSRAALALPEGRVQRRLLALPTPLRRSEYRAVLRLHVRRALPAPASVWRYCLSSEHHRPHLLAARHTDLQAGQTLLRDAGLRPVALVASRDALAHAAGAPPQPLPDTPGARLARALAEAARRPGPNNLLHARNPSAHGADHSLRTAAGAALAIGLAGVAAHAHWGAPTGSFGSHDATNTAEDRSPSPPPEPDPDPEPPTAEPAPPAEPASQLPPDPADARRQAIPGWLDTLAKALPEGTRLKTVELGETLAIEAVTAQPEHTEAYLNALQEAGFEAVHLAQMRRTEHGLRRLSLRGRPQLRDEPPAAPPETTLREQLGDLSRELEAHGLVLEDLHRQEGDDDEVVARLHIAGEYAALREWLAAEAESSRRRGVHRLHLHAAEPPRLEAEVTIALHPPEVQP